MEPTGDPQPRHSVESRIPPEPGAKPGMPTWMKVVLVAGALFLCLPVLAGLIGTVAIVVPQMQDKQKRFTCVNNLSQLGGMFILARSEAERGEVPMSGPALFLEWRKSQSRIRAGQESLLRCPGDPQVAPPGTPGIGEAYDAVDLAHVPRSLCSYAVRDFEKFPLDTASDEVQVIAVCIHHRRGANIVFDDGSARFFESDELGLGPDDELTVGPTSESEYLQVVRYGDGSVR